MKDLLDTLIGNAIAPSGSGGQGGGVELNIAYGEEAPSDTSKIWIKADEPESLEIKNGSTLPTLYSFDLYGSMNPKYKESYSVHGGYTHYKNGLAVLNTNGSNGLALTKFDISTKTVSNVDYTYIKPVFGVGYDELRDRIYFYYWTGSYGHLDRYYVDPNGLSTDAVLVNRTQGASNDDNDTYVIGRYIYRCINGRTVYRSDLNNPGQNEDYDSRVSLTTYPRYGGCVIGNKIYFFGTDDKIGILDSETNTYSEKKVFPYSLYNKGYRKMSCSAIGNDLYIFNPSTDSSTSTNTVLKLNTLTDSCETLDVSCTDTNLCYAATFGDNIYVYSTNGSVYEFKTGWNIQPNNGELYLTAGSGISNIKLIDTDTLKQSIVSCRYYYGDENGKAVKAQSYYHNGTNWVEFT